MAALERRPPRERLQVWLCGCRINLKGCKQRHNPTSRRRLETQALRRRRCRHDARHGFDSRREEDASPTTMMRSVRTTIWLTTKQKLPALRRAFEAWHLRGPHPLTSKAWHRTTLATAQQWRTPAAMRKCSTSCAWRRPIPFKAPDRMSHLVGVNVVLHVADLSTCKPGSCKRRTAFH